MTIINRRNLLIGAGAAGVVAGAGLYSISGPGASLVPGVSRARAITTDTKLVDAVDVVVIGGGFVGTSTALSLAQRGISVALFEKGVIAGEASGRSMGLVEAQFCPRAWMPIIEHSKQQWRRLNELTGEETGYRQRPVVSFFDSDEALATGSAWLDSVKGLPNGGSRILSARETAKLLPDAVVPYKGALFGSEEGLTEPKLAAPGIALGARKLGAKVYQNCAVRGIERTGGRVSGVVTEMGTVRTSIVILAGGVWSPVFARSLGLELPQLNGFSSYLSIEPQEGPEFSAMLPGTAFRKEIDGGYTVGPISGLAPITPSTFRYMFDLLPAMMALSGEIKPRFSWSNFWREWNIPEKWPLDQESPFEKLRIFQPEVNEVGVEDALRALKKALPAFQNAQVRERWAGGIMTTLDNMPVISAVEQIPGLILGTGFLYGLTMGPGAGELLADLATGTKPAIDITPFRHSRFIDGTKLEFQS